MASSAKKNTTIDPEQRKLIENAQRRIRQKKRLTTHFVAFLAGSIIFIVLNLVLKFGENFRPFKTDWFVWAILIWLFFFLIHLFNVLFVSKLMGKNWEENQLERLVKLQQKKIEKLQKQVEKEHPLPKNDTQPNRIEPKNNDLKF
ncbi:2TM domain-containing protein [Mesonia aquimarina]|uniref:2TM domain-containing protein n=1 Tax=Mesonia aquimarina TaxID=1504967 RepID=UPI000EF5B8D8|nr:2TM domain-containing protein [Mesonia aquimarina]